MYEEWGMMGVCVCVCYEILFYILNFKFAQLLLEQVH